MIKKDEKQKALDKAYLKAGHNAYFANGFLNGVEFSENKLRSLVDMFPNGFDSWQETHFEIVSAINKSVDVNGSMANKTIEAIGSGGLYDLAKELTNKFENQYINIEWGEEMIYQDVIEEFINKEL